MRRLLIAIAFALLGASASTSSASAKPKVAVTVGGDADDQMGAAVREVLDGKLEVVDRKDVERAMSKLGLSGELEDGDAQRLRQRLDAAVVVQGKVGRAGAKKTLKLTVWVRGKKPSDFNVQYKSAGSEKFRGVVRDELLKRIGSVSDLDEEDKPKKKKLTDADEDKPKKKLADSDEDKPKKKKLADSDEDKPKKKKLADADEDRPKSDEDKPKKKKLADADEDKPKSDEDKPRKKKKKVATADDDQPSVRKRKRSVEGGGGEGVREEPAAALAAARVDAGIAYGARTLGYAFGANATNKPPKVLTPAGSLRIEGELYPAALSNRSGAAAGFGIFGEYGKTFGLSITVPGTMGKSTPIDQAHYAIGALYRFAFGKSAFSAGAAYTNRHYIADRSSLTAPTQLDMPDVDYAAVSPVLGLRTQVARSASLFVNADAALVLSAGAIAKGDNYGSGDVFGIGGTGGIDIALGKQVGLRVAGEFSQINLSFKGTGSMASARQVTGATDRDFGATATLAAWY